MVEQIIFISYYKNKMKNAELLEQITKDVVVDKDTQKQLQEVLEYFVS
jgi:hypothetical protein